MRFIIDDDVVLSRPLEGPLASQVTAFAKWAREQGYAWHPRYRRVLLAACFSRWLRQKAVGVRRVSSEHQARYLRSRARHVQIQTGDATALTQFMNFLRRHGIVPREKIPPRRLIPTEQIVHTCQSYLRKERMLAEATVVYYVTFVRKFLVDQFSCGPVKLSRLSAGDVVRFVQRQAPCLHLKRAKLLTTALRSFLHYARYRGQVTCDLAIAVPTVANWSMPSVPRAIPADAVRQLLASINRHTTIGRRDYAILLLLARLGLRASEVMRLKLEDIDWNAGTISVQGKGDQPSVLPLPADVGSAIVTYLRRGRPRCSSRHVFLRTIAPIHGLRNPASIAFIVQQNLARAGIKAPTRGAHQFRHALATEMLHHGASLAEIGDVLRHRSLETTKIYTKVDLNSLRALALPCAGRCAMNTLRQAVQEYLTLRRSLGFKLYKAGKLLPAFVKFMEERRASYITSKLALAWAQQPSAVQPVVWAQRLSVVRTFARHRSATDPRTQIPPQSLLPYRPQRARPYLYSTKEIQALLRVALSLSPRGGLRPWTYHCLFGLLSVTGMRLGEICNLEIQDVSLRTNVLTIRNTKFGKTRQIPIHPSTRRVLADYLVRRSRRWARRPVSSYVFVSNRGNRLDHGQIHRTFYVLSRQVGFRGPSDRHGPRLHDMRHRFAVMTLLRWYRSGKDVEQKLPYLSAYLGHVHISDTYWYLSAWPELMREAMSRLEGCWEGQS